MGSARRNESSGRRWLWLLLVTGSLAVLAVLARPLATGAVRVSTDLGNFHLPIRAFYARSLAEGVSFIWFPHLFSGFYVHGEGQAGLFHPLNWLSYRWLPLEVAFDLELLRSYLALWLGAFWLLRRWALPRDAAGFGAFVFSFSGFALLHYVHLNVVAALAHLPFLLVAIDWMLRPRRRREVVFGPLAIVLLSASQLMLGHPQIAWISAVVEGGCALGTIASIRRLPGALARALSLFGAKLLGVAAAGIALLPIWDSLRDSFRAMPPEGFTADFAIAPLGLIQLVAPYLFANRVVGENTAELAVYLGAVPLLLSVWVLARGRLLGPRWPLAAGAGAAGAAALLLCMGDAGGLYRLQETLPVVGLFRAPARYVLVVHAAAAVLSAVGVAELLAAPRRETRSRLALLLAPLAVSVAAALLLSFASELPLARSWLARGAGPALVAAATLGLWAAARGVPGALFGLLLLGMVDLAGYGLSFVEREPPTTIDAYLERFDLPERTGTDRLYWGPPAVTIAGIHLASGYAAMTPNRVLNLGHEDEVFWRGRHLRIDERVRIDKNLRNALRVAGVRWAIGGKLPPPLPRARLVSRVLVSDYMDRDIGEIDVATTALVDALPTKPLGGGAPGTAEIRRDDPGDVQIAVSAPNRQLLVLSESHHSGWRATVDAAPATVLRVYGDYLGVVVEPGAHEVRFRFQPASLRQGAWLSAIALALALGWTLVRALRAARLTDPTH